MREALINLAFFFSLIPNVHLLKDLGWEINLRFWLSKMKVLM